MKKQRTTFRYTLRIFASAKPEGEPLLCIDYSFPGAKIRGGSHSSATSDSAAASAATGTWAYLLYPASQSQSTAEQYGVNEQLEPIAQELQPGSRCAELWRVPVLRFGMPATRLRSLTDVESAGRGWSDIEAAIALSKIS